MGVQEPTRVRARAAARDPHTTAARSIGSAGPWGGGDQVVHGEVLGLAKTVAGMPFVGGGGHRRGT